MANKRTKERPQLEERACNWDSLQLKQYELKDRILPGDKGEEAS